MGHSNHMKLASELLVDLFADIFTSFIIHCYVPTDILRGVITPLVKDKLGNLTTSSNYRPVMSSSIFLKLFEYCLLSKIEPYVNLNDRQHGFRKTYSTSSACLSLKETVMHYTKGNSDVYVCFLDISKAFDSVSHNILMSKLIETGIPEYIVHLIEFWYANQYVNVKYNSAFSEDWKVNNGVRQGGVLSGLLFNIYIDALISKISKLDIGCNLGLLRSNIVAYADDIVLIAPSAKALQFLMNVAAVEISKLQLNFNLDKTKTMVFRSSSNRSNALMLESHHINGHPVECVTSIRYLGYILTFDLNNTDDMNRVKSKFYIEFNSILRKFTFADNYVKLFLFKQYCLQFYGAELWFGCRRSSQAFHQFAVGYHKAIKKLLNLSSHESNHYACQEASLYLFKHFINKTKICLAFRILFKPCEFINKNLDFLKISSVMLGDVNTILTEQYQIDSISDNDFDAIMARISYVQNHEPQMRVPI